MITTSTLNNYNNHKLSSYLNKREILCYDHNIDPCNNLDPNIDYGENLTIKEKSSAIKSQHTT